MESARSSHVVELKREIALLKHDEKRLQWVILSSSATVKLKAQAREDLPAVLERLKKAGSELTRIERIR